MNLEKKLLKDLESEVESPAVNNGSDRKFSVKALVVEVISIVIGVLLALALSEWSEERNHQTQAKIALENIATEILANHKLLTVIHDNNLETLEAMHNQPESGEGDDRTYIPGLQLRKTAWDALLSTGLSNYISYDKVLVLSEMYAIQDVYKQTGTQLVEATMTASAYATVLATDIDNSQFQKQFGMYFEMLSGIETQLLLVYDNALTNIESDT